MARYTNIPGVNMDIKDGQLMLGQDNTSNSILIIADVNASTNVVVPEEPVLVRNESDLKANFGGFFYKGKVNPIAAEWAVAFRQGLGNIYLFGLKGTTDKEKFINLQDMLFNTLRELNIEQVVLNSLYADTDIEGLTAVDFGGESLDAIEGIEAAYVRRAAEVPTALATADDFVITYSGIEVAATIEASEGQALVDNINREVRNALAEEGLDIKVTVELVDGKAVMKTSDEVVIEAVAIMTALGLNLVEPVLEGIGNPAALLGEYAEKQATESTQTLCYVGVKPVVSTNMASIRDYVNALVARNNEVSRYVQVVAGPEVGITLPGSLRTQWLNGVTQYALLVQALPAQVAPTNQVLPQANALRYNLGMRQIDRLSGNKYVTYRIKNNAITIVDGVTTAPDLYVGQDIVHSDFTRLSTVRTIGFVTNRMRTVLDAFVGQPNHFEIYNAMRTSIKAEIRDAISNAIIQDASFSIQMGDSLDTAVVKLTILPQFELRHIEVSIGLTTPDNFEG